MAEKKHTRGEVNFKILAYLLTSDIWRNIREIGMKVGKTQNSDRLKGNLEELVEREIIQKWENLTPEQQTQARKTQNEEIFRKNNYKISDLGRTKFNKIRDDCLDPDTRVILRMQSTE